MAKFKAGDKVRMLQECSDSRLGEIYTLTEYGGTLIATTPMKLGLDRGSCECQNKWELVNTPVSGLTIAAKRRFKLLKDTDFVEKGAIYEEECDDGTQPYKCVTPNKIKFGYGNHRLNIRKSVEDNPSWYQEVFSVQMTESELEEYYAFKKLQKGGNKTAAVVKKTKSRK